MRRISTFRNLELALFGVISYTVSTRKIELGIRMALGATPAGIRKGVLAEGGRLVLTGIPLGFLGAAMLAHLIGGPVVRGRSRRPHHLRVCCLDARRSGARRLLGPRT